MMNDILNEVWCFWKVLKYYFYTVSGHLQGNEESKVKHPQIHSTALPVTLLKLHFPWWVPNPLGMFKLPMYSSLLHHSLCVLSLFLHFFFFNFDGNILNRWSRTRLLSTMTIHINNHDDGPFYDHIHVLRHFMQIIKTWSSSLSI